MRAKLVINHHVEQGEFASMKEVREWTNEIEKKHNIVQTVFAQTFRIDRLNFKQWGHGKFYLSVHVEQHELNKQNRPI